MSKHVDLIQRWRRDADQYQRQVEEARAKHLPHDQMLSFMVCLRSCARDLENEPWVVEDARMLREQIRVADAAFQRLHEEHQKLLAQTAR